MGEEAEILKTLNGRKSNITVPNLENTVEVESLFQPEIHADRKSWSWPFDVPAYTQKHACWLLDRESGVVGVLAETRTVPSQHSDDEQNEEQSREANKAESGRKVQDLMPCESLSWLEATGFQVAVLSDLVFVCPDC